MSKAKRVSKDQLTQNDIKTFESAIKKQGISDCFVLKKIPGRCDGTFFKCDDGTMITQKRLAYAIEFGECKEGFALYSNGKCHNSRCVNPHHYKLVDQKHGYNYSNDTKQNDEVDNGEFEYEPLSAQNVKDYAKSEHDELDKEIRHATKDCESPIEELFAIALWKIVSHPEFLSGYEDIVEKQRKFTFGETTYRVDFCITRVSTIPYTGQSIVRTVVVECDGWDYHYATPEQVERDHERDRAFMLHGITVIHFTGSEINKSPDECAESVLTILNEETEAAQFEIMNFIEEHKEATDEVHD